MADQLLAWRCTGASALVGYSPGFTAGKVYPLIAWGEDYKWVRVHSDNNVPVTMDRAGSFYRIKGGYASYLFGGATGVLTLNPGVGDGE